MCSQKEEILELQHKSEGVEAGKDGENVFTVKKERREEAQRDGRRFVSIY